MYVAAYGLKLLIKKYGRDHIQNRFFNVWTHDCYVKLVLVFTPDRKAQIAIINIPGTFHARNMTDYGFYHRLQKIYDAMTGKVVVDSAFNISTTQYAL